MLARSRHSSSFCVQCVEWLGPWCRCMRTKTPNSKKYCEMIAQNPTRQSFSARACVYVYLYVFIPCLPLLMVERGFHVSGAAPQDSVPLSVVECSSAPADLLSTQPNPPFYLKGITSVILHSAVIARHTSQGGRFRIRRNRNVPGYICSTLCGYVQKTRTAMILCKIR